MLPLDDPRWNNLLGGYRTLYDPRPIFTRLANGVDVDAAWLELWNGLQHQGDLGEASYAAVPHLVRIHRECDVANWNTYALCGTIELGRGSRNPPVPSWLEPGYSNAIQEIGVLAIKDLRQSTDPVLVRAATGALLLARGLRADANLLLSYTDDEIEEMVDLYVDR